jgi:hypothetical protein
MIGRLSNWQAKQSDPWQAWMMFYWVCKMFQSGKKKQLACFDELVHKYTENVEINMLGPQFVQL